MIARLSETLETFAHAVDVNDVVDPETSLPSPIPVSCDEAQMRACFDLCFAFWRQGADRGELRRLIAGALWRGSMSEADKVRYKAIRATYKQLRFALVLYGREHAVPRLLARTVISLGQLQDHLRNGRRLRGMGRALLLLLLVSGPAWALVEREVSGVALDDADGFLAFRKAELGRLRAQLEAGPVDAHTFHAMRKVVSRQVSFYDAMRTLAPREDVTRMSRYLSAINGLMGAMHDELVLEVARGQRDYDTDPVAMPEDLRMRLEALVSHYPAFAANEA